MFPFLAINIFIFIASAIAAIVYTILLFIGSGNYSHGVWIALVITAGLNPEITLFPLYQRQFSELKSIFFLSISFSDLLVYYSRIEFTLQIYESNVRIKWHEWSKRQTRNGLWVCQCLKLPIWKSKYKIWVEISMDFHRIHSKIFRNNILLEISMNSDMYMLTVELQRCTEGIFTFLLHA